MRFYYDRDRERGRGRVAQSSADALPLKSYEQFQMKSSLPRYCRIICGRFVTEKKRHGWTPLALWYCTVAFSGTTKNAPSPNSKLVLVPSNWDTLHTPRPKRT